MYCSLHPLSQNTVLCLFLAFEKDASHIGENIHIGDYVNIGLSWD